MTRIMFGAISLLVLASAASADTTYIGVNFNGQDADGNWGFSVNGPSNLAPTDVAFGQSGWTNVMNNVGWDNGPWQDIYTSTGTRVGSVHMLSDYVPLAGCRYNGDGVNPGSSGFAYPTTPEQVLYNGLDYNMNHGTVSVTLDNGVPAGGYTMNIFGSGGPVTVYLGGAPVGTTAGSLGSFASPGYSSLTLPAAAGPVTYTFGDHGNFDYNAPWEASNSPLISAFQFVSGGGQPNPPVLTTSIPDATPISLTSPTSTTLTLGNSGGGTITGTAGVSGGDASLFTVTPGTVNLGASATQDYTVSFIGTAVGTFGTTLSILTDAGNLSYALSATVTAPAWPDYLAGDFNKDGQVGPEDFGILKDQFGNSNLAHGNHESWTLGDANDDGQVGPEDFGLLKDNFGSSNGPTGTYPLANVPEPTTLALLALAGLAIRRKQR